MELSTGAAYTVVPSTDSQWMTDQPDTGPALLVPLDDVYYAVHITAICVQTISIFCSAFVIFWQGKRSGWQSFWKRRMSERLVIYLSVNDLVYSLSHCGDHILIMAANGRVLLAKACVFFGGVLTLIVCAQTVMVFLQALNALVIVAFNKHIAYGKYDIGFLLITYGIPVPVIALFIINKYFGYSGYWCFMDALNPKAQSMGQTFGLVHSLTSLVIIVMYAILIGSVWKSNRAVKHFNKSDTKIKSGEVSEITSDTNSISVVTKMANTSMALTAESTQTETMVDANLSPYHEDIEDAPKAFSGDSNMGPEIKQEDGDLDNEHGNPPETKASDKKIHSNTRSARHVRVLKVCSLFVVAYFAQWWPSIVFYGMVPFDTDPGRWYVMTLAVFANAGGLFNMLAYSVLRNVITEQRG